MSSALPKLPPIGGARATTSAYDERMTTPDRSRYQDDFYAWTQHCPRLAPWSLDEICREDWYPGSPERR